MDSCHNGCTTAPGRESGQGQRRAGSRWSWGLGLGGARTVPLPHIRRARLGGCVRRSGGVGGVQGGYALTQHCGRRRCRRPHSWHRFAEAIARGDADPRAHAVAPFLTAVARDAVGGRAKAACSGGVPAAVDLTCSGRHGAQQHLAARHGGADRVRVEENRRRWSHEGEAAP